MDLYPDFKEFLQLLKEENVEYLVGGGYAVTWHGYPRFTSDIVIWINPTQENARKMLVVLERFGAGGVGIREEDFLNPEIEVLKMGVPPVRIDLMTTMKGLEFSQAFASRESYDASGVSIFILSLADLRKAKKAANRPKDKDDLLHLPKPNKKSK